MILKTLAILFSFILFTGCGSSETASIQEGQTENTVQTMTIEYEEDSRMNMLNPDRGFYDADYELNKLTNNNMFENVLSEGYTLVYAPLNLEEYNTTTILPDSLLNTLSKNLYDANTSGIKLIFRIKYRSGLNGNDPSKELIMGHLNQLKPLLQHYKETISVVQAGIIGAWGEWHNFTGDFAETTPEYKSNRRDIVEKLFEIFPDKYIQLRTPMHKELLFGASTVYAEKSSEGEITPETAFTNDPRAKIGQHNDCVLSNATDMGTYASDNIPFWKEYVANDSNYAPIGGETCGIGEGEDAFLSDCNNAIAEFSRMHYSFLNDVYHPDILQKWKDEGCYDTIKQNLGYRLVAQKLIVTQTEETLSFSLDIINKGYAAPYRKSNISFLLKNNTQTYTFPQNIDLRTFYAHQSKKLTASIALSSLQKSTYCLYIKIGENISAIKLSNYDMWEEESLSNRLTCDISVE